MLASWVFSRVEIGFRRSNRLEAIHVPVRRQQARELPRPRPWDRRGTWSAWEWRSGHGRRAHSFVIRRSPGVGSCSRERSLRRPRTLRTDGPDPPGRHPRSSGRTGRPCQAGTTRLPSVHFPRKHLHEVSKPCMASDASLARSDACAYLPRLRFGFASFIRRRGFVRGASTPSGRRPAAFEVARGSRGFVDFFTTRQV